MGAIKNFYEHKYKWTMVFTLLIVVLALGQIVYQYIDTGDFVNKGISLKGGSSITLNEASISSAELESYLQGKFPQSDVSVRTLSSAGTTTGLAVDSNLQEKIDIDSLVEAINQKITLKEREYSVEVIGSSLGNSFFRQTITALLIAFCLMGIVVFLYFRSVAPSMAVIAAAFSDIVVTLAIFNLTGQKLSSAGVAAFLMLVGYSVDSDILLTSRVLKRTDGTVLERVYGAIKTGLTMTGTTIAAVLVAFLFVQSEVIKQIMFILLIGLFVDMIMTWIQNVGLLRLYLEKKGKKQ